MNKYINYYNGDNTQLCFEFLDISERTALRMESFLLQDSSLFVSDRDVLEKISKDKKEIDTKKDSVYGKISISYGDETGRHYLLSGTLTTDSDCFSYRGTIDQTINLIMVRVEKRKSDGSLVGLSHFAWVHDYLCNPNCLYRTNMVRSYLTDMYRDMDLEGEDIEYSIPDDFSLYKDPKNFFKGGEVKIKVKTK